MARKPFQPRTLEATSGDEPLSGVAEAEAIEESKPVRTIKGQLIPENLAHLIPYALTDQGIAELAASPKLRATPGVSMGRDEFDKKAQGGGEVWDSFDPLTEAVDGVREPGMRYRFLSDRIHKRRGRRGWETVTGKDGKQVLVAGMTLGKMSEEAAERRNAHYREIGKDALANAAESYESTQAKAIHDAKVSGLAPLRAGERVADNTHHPGMVAEIGVHSRRGAAE